MTAFDDFCPDSILIVGPSWIGDMVMAQALFQQLVQQYPGVAIDVLAPAWSKPLLARMPQVRKALDLPLAHGEIGLGKRWRLGRELKSVSYDQAIILPNSFKSALVTRFAGIPRRTGWRGEMRGGLLNDCRRLDKNALPLMVQRFLALALPGSASLPHDLPDPLPVPQLRTAEADVKQACRDLVLTIQRPVLALCPGAEFGDAKQWPAEHYAAVASSKLRQGWQVWLFGSEKDRAVADEIQAIVSGSDTAGDVSARCANLAGRTTLAQAIDLLSLACAVVSNDSGLMHIAAALHRPLVAVYGSTSTEFTPPLTDRVELLHTDIECRPCFQRICPLQHKRCLTELMPEQVLEALERLQAPLLATDSATGSAQSR